MLEAALAKNLELLYAVGGNFLDTLPQPDDVQAALERVPVRVHQDIVLSRAMLVDPDEAVYLLPAKTRYEHIGGVTETTTERRVIYSPLVPGHDIGEAREEWRIALELAQAAWPERAEQLHFADAAAVRADIADTIPSYRGIELLAKKGDQFQWGGERLCEGGVFPLPNGRARFVFSGPPDSKLAADRFHLGTRRGKQFNSMVQAEVDQLTGAARDHVLMNVEDMRQLDLAQDAPIRVTSAHGAYDGRAFSAPMVRGAVQMHWPEANVLIASGPRDPGGLVPDYNAIVRIEARGTHDADGLDADGLDADGPAAATGEASRERAHD
jgi:predicted molibdopterin-dependent oxidoreductase YjgC